MVGPAGAGDLLHGPVPTPTFGYGLHPDQREKVEAGQGRPDGDRIAIKVQDRADAAGNFEGRLLERLDRREVGTESDTRVIVVRGAFGLGVAVAAYHQPAVAAPQRHHLRFGEPSEPSQRRGNRINPEQSKPGAVDCANQTIVGRLADRAHCVGVAVVCLKEVISGLDGGDDTNPARKAERLDHLSQVGGHGDRQPDLVVDDGRLLDRLAAEGGQAERVRPNNRHREVRRTQVQPDHRLASTYPKPVLHGVRHAYSASR